MDYTIQVVIILILLLLSSYFSSAETALTTSNKIRMRSLADAGNKSAKRVCKLIDNPSKMLSTILIGNNIVNLTCSSMVTSLAINYFHSISVGVATGILTIYILIFGEIIPKSLATIKADKLALFFSSSILALSTILTPAIFIVDKISYVFIRIIHIDPNAREATITETELRAIVDVSHEEGVIESEERKMITNVVDFGDTVVKDVMVPQIDVDFADINLSYDDLMNSFTENKYSRLPVYSSDKDNVVGIINLKDMFFYSDTKDNFHISDLMREPFFTYEFKKTSELFIEMKTKSIPMAIVLDEYGSVAGIITMEDMLEEIVGEIRDEYDGDEEDPIIKIGENIYLVDGYAKLDDVNEVLGLNLISDDYDSIAGHLINLFDHIPVIGETTTDGQALYEVKELDKNRISKIQITVLKNSQKDESEDGSSMSTT